jgi:hypothetical protein
MKDFKKLHVWQNGMEIVDMIFDLANQLPSDEKFGIRSQITRNWIAEERIGSVLENIISEQKILVKFIEKLES